MSRCAVVLVVSCIAAAAIACGGSGSLETYEGNGISFQYPGEFRSAKVISSTDTGGTKLWDAAIGVTADDGVFLTAYRLNATVTQELFDKRYQQIVDEVVSATPRTAQVTSPATRIEVAGLPAFEFRVEGELRPGVKTSNRAISVYSGTTQILITCQVRDEKNAAAVGEACQSVLDTLEVE